MSSATRPFARLLHHGLGTHYLLLLSDGRLHAYVDEHARQLAAQARGPEDVRRCSACCAAAVEPSPRACERLDDLTQSSIATCAGFEYVSNKVFEEELERANSVPAGAFGALGL